MSPIPPVAPAGGRGREASFSSLLAQLTPKSAFSRFPLVHRADLEGQQRVEAVWKLSEILQTNEQSKIFRDFFDSERSKASQERTKQARVKTRLSFYTASVESDPTFFNSGTSPSVKIL
jgi:hypothetical protein